MIVFLDCDDALDVCAAEMGLERGQVKQLLSPTTRRLRQKEHDEFAVDNGAFSGLRLDSFRYILERERESKHLCKFVVVPDVVADARRTLEIFDCWKYRLSGWPLALAIQDGIENVRIPWEFLAAVFIGGSTEFKLGPRARAVIQAAKAMEKWVHAGRVNVPARYEYFEELGADSIDGTGLSRFSHMRAQFLQPSLLPREKVS